jgi:hypothetical protein
MSPDEQSILSEHTDGIWRQDSIFPPPGPQCVPIFLHFYHLILVAL